MAAPWFRFRSAARFVVMLVAASLLSTLLVGSARSAHRAAPLIAFTRSDGVYVMRTDGSGVRLLRRTGSWTPWVTWSPDGRKLAFVSFSYGKPVVKGGVWVMNADGTDPVRLARLSVVPSRPTWSPDSRRIAFIGSTLNGSNLRQFGWTVNADGSDRRQFTPPNLPTGVGVVAVDWNPTGGPFAFVAGSWGPPGGGIYVMNAYGGKLRNLTPEGASGEPDWSPNGRRIVYTHASGGEARYEEIWVMNANGGSKVQLTNNHVPDYEPTWSPDGRKIAFVGAYAGRGSGEIYVINADGTGFTRLTHNRVSEASPSWQPVAH